MKKSVLGYAHLEFLMPLTLEFPSLFLYLGENSAIISSNWLFFLNIFVYVSVSEREKEKKMRMSMENRKR